MQSLKSKILAEILKEADKENPGLQAKSPFEKDPMGFILRKYTTLNEVLTELMTPSFQQYLNAIFIVAPKPTTFKVLLHNGQFFFLTFLGKAYQATIQGKDYYLMTIGEKERCMQAIARLLRFGSPLKTKGPEGAEQGTDGATDAGTSAAEADDLTSGVAGEDTTGGGEEALSEQLVVKELLEGILQLNEKKEKNALESMEASDFEVYATHVLTMVLNKEKWNENTKSTIKGVPLKLGKELYDQLKIEVENNSIGGKKTIEKYANNHPTSVEWKDWTKKETDVPKTDIYGKDLRVSVKKGAAQLMSPETAELNATWKAALKLSRLDEEAKELAQQEIDKLEAITKGKKEKGVPGFVKKAEPQLDPEGNPVLNKKGKPVMVANPLSRTDQGLETGELKDIGGLGGKGKGPEAAARARKKAEEETGISKKELSAHNKKVLKYIEEVEEVHRAYSEKMMKLFDNNPKLQRAFVYEAATGAVKFGGKGGDGNSRAEWLLATNLAATKCHIKPVKKPSDKGIEDLSGRLKFAVNFKTGSYGGKEKLGYSFYTTVRIGLNDYAKEQEKVVQKEQKLRENKKTLMQEGLWDDAISVINKAWNWLKQKWNQLIDWISNALKAATDLIKQGVDGLLGALGIEPEVTVENDGIIDFGELA